MAGSSPKNPDADTIRDVMLAPFIHKHALAEQTVVGLLKIYMHTSSKEEEEEVLYRLIRSHDPPPCFMDTSLVLCPLLVC